MCPCHYLGVPALSWHAIHSMTKVEINLISELDMYLFFEKGMRGGVFIFLKDTAKQTYLTSYNPKNQQNLNENNLFGDTMSKSLPTGRFKWLDSAKFNLNMMMTIPEVAF